MAQGGHGCPGLAVCRAGLAVAVTGALAAGGGTPYAGAVLVVGLVLLAAGGWLTNRKKERR